jgi:hypothetical protein
MEELLRFTVIDPSAFPKQLTGIDDTINAGFLHEASMHRKEINNMLKRCLI